MARNGHIPILFVVDESVEIPPFTLFPVIWTENQHNPGLFGFPEKREKEVISCDI